jgi:hypothetical protein
MTLTYLALLAQEDTSCRILWSVNLGRKRALANNDDESDDDDLPSLEEVFRTAPRLKVSTEASKTEHTLQHLKQPALERSGIQVDRTKSGLGERQRNSRGRRAGCPSYEEAVR